MFIPGLQGGEECHDAAAPVSCKAEVSQSSCRSLLRGPGEEAPWQRMDQRSGGSSQIHLYRFTVLFTHLYKRKKEKEIPEV